MADASMASGKPNNTRTALILAALAFAFFIAIMLKYWLAK